jgi:hypothetical protein
MPASTLSYASVMVEEAEKRFYEEGQRTRCPDELHALGLALTALYDAYGWHPIKTDGSTHPPLGSGDEPASRGIAQGATRARAWSAAMRRLARRVFTPRA